MVMKFMKKKFKIGGPKKPKKPKPKPKPKPKKKVTKKGKKTKPKNPPGVVSKKTLAGLGAMGVTAAGAGSMILKDPKMERTSPFERTQNKKRGGRIR